MTNFEPAIGGSGGGDPTGDGAVADGDGNFRGEMLFLIVAAGGPTVRTPERIATEQQAGHRVRVIATPQAAQWLDPDEIEHLTGFPMESAMLTPAVSTLEPPGQRVLASPVTLNTLTKWADGHADNLALGLLCEALGAGVPIVAELSLSPQFLRHPATMPAIERLREAGVEFRTHPYTATPINWPTVEAGEAAPPEPV